MKKFISLLTLLIMITTYLNAQTVIETISLRSDSTNINYIKNGEGETTLLFIHGWCINKNYWKDQISFFSNSYNVIALDLPGFGHSTATRKNWTIEEYAKDVIAFIEALQLENVVLIGHSMGGDIMLEVALQNHPSVKGLIGIDNFKSVGIEFTPEEAKKYSDFFQLMEKDFDNMSAVYADQFLFQPSTDSLTRNRVKADFGLADENIAMATITELMQYWAKESEKLNKLNYKLNLLNSDATPTNKAGLQENCKSSFEVYDIHATGHYPMIEKPEEFNRILSRILEDL